MITFSAHTTPTRFLLIVGRNSKQKEALPVIMSGKDHFDLGTIRLSCLQNFVRPYGSIATASPVASSNTLKTIAPSNHNPQKHREKLQRKKRRHRTHCAICITYTISSTPILQSRREPELANEREKNTYK